MPWLKEAQAPPTPPTPASGLTADKVVEWLKAGVPADTVLHDVERDMTAHGTLFHLTHADEQRLRDAGASPELLKQMGAPAGK